MDKKAVQDIIEEYVQGTLSMEDRATFEGWLQKDADLQAEVEATKLALLTTERLQQEEMLKQFQAWGTDVQTTEKPKFKSYLWTILGVLGLIALCAYFYVYHNINKAEVQRVEQVEIELPQPSATNEIKESNKTQKPDANPRLQEKAQKQNQAPQAQPNYKERPIAMHLSTAQNHVLNDEVPLSRTSIVRGTKPDKNKYPIWARLESARTKILEGDAKAAQETLLAIPENDIYWAKAQMLLGHLYLWKNQCVKALKAFNNAYNRDNKDKQIRYSLWVGYTSCGLENSAAASQIKAEIKNDKRNPYRDKVE